MSIVPSKKQFHSARPKMGKSTVIFIVFWEIRAHLYNDIRYHTFTSYILLLLLYVYGHSCTANTRWWDSRGLAGCTAET